MVSLIVRYSSVVFLILKDVFKNKIVQAKNWLGIPQVMDILRLDICPMLAILTLFLPDRPKPSALLFYSVNHQTIIIFH